MRPDTDVIVELEAHLGGERLRLAAPGLERVLAARWPDPPAAGDPPAVVGRLDDRAESLPLLDLARCLGLPCPPLSPTQHFAVLRTALGRAAVRVGRVTGLCVIRAGERPVHDLAELVESACAAGRAVR